MREDQYKKDFMERLAPQTAKWFPNRNFLFLHDSAAFRKAKSLININTLDWPRNPLDLNSIENVWAVIKTDVAKEKVVSNKTKLIIKACHNIPRPQQVGILKTAKFGNTKY